MTHLFALSASVCLHASVDEFAELLDLLKGLLIFLFHFSDDLERAMLLAEDAIVALSVYALYFQKVVRSSRTFDVERDHASRMLALDTRAISFSADYALQIKSLGIDLAHTYRCFRCHGGPRDPHRAAKMDPLIQRICRYRIDTFQALLVPLKEEGVVFWDLSDGLRLEEVQLDIILREVFSILSLLICHLFLVATLSIENLRQCVVLVLTLEELQALVPVRATLLA